MTEIPNGIMPVWVKVKNKTS